MAPLKGIEVVAAHKPPLEGEVAEGRRGFICSPVEAFGWVPPAGSFLSRQEAPQECGLRGRCQKADKLRCDCHRQSFMRFAARRTALLKNSPGLKTNRACTCGAYRVCSHHSTQPNENYRQ